jgi:SAM-dependent methyltransferase
MTMHVTNTPNGEQTRLWNDHAGRAWVDAQELLDAMLKPFEERLVEAVSAASGTQILDVGCGTGGTTLALARSLGPKGHCVGIDISEPMIAAARARAERERTPASFIQADAQTYAFEPSRFDMVVSRFGVMFFEDFVAAFENLRRAAKAQAELRVIAWRGASENSFMTTAERAAAPLLPNFPARNEDAPGQFAFGDRHRVYGILQQSGWAEVDIRPLDVTCTLLESELVRYLSRMGPLGRVLGDVDEQTRTEVIKTVRAAFEPYVHGAEVRFTAACWSISARAPSAPLRGMSAEPAAED